MEENIVSTSARFNKIGEFEAKSYGNSRNYNFRTVKTRSMDM